jgi:hypothetical protein
MRENIRVWRHGEARPQTLDRGESIYGEDTLRRALEDLARQLDKLPLPTGAAIERYLSQKAIIVGAMRRIARRL